MVFTCNQINKSLKEEFAEGTKKSLYEVYDNNFVKLFVFGDSYVDTGNYLNSPSYKPPYGMTFPGKPSGRFSDGRILTDYVGNFSISLARSQFKKHLTREYVCMYVFLINFDFNAKFREKE